MGLIPTKDNDKTFIFAGACRYTTLSDTVMPFATAFFDSDNTTIVLTKDYINCERNYFITFNDDCLVHALTATVNDVATVEMDT